MLLGCAPERRRRAGRSASLAAPRAALREPRLPRRPCGIAPHRLEVRAVGPLRACHPWNMSRIFVPRCTRSEISSGPLPVSCARKARWPPYHGIEVGVPSLRLAFKGRASASTVQAAAHAGGPSCAPHRGATPPARAPPASTFSQPPSRPYNLLVPPLPLPRPEVRRSTARSDRAPWAGHKLVVGKPLVLPHPFPDQTRHRSRPILAGTAASMAKGLHSVSFIISRVFFVNQGPIRNRNKSSRDRPVKPSLK
jgi:hypothetical protein